MKPENILFTLNGRILITDFGFSKTLQIYSTQQIGAAGGVNNKLQSLVGSIPYLAPELVSGEELYSEKVDIWSTGLIF